MRRSLIILFSIAGSLLLFTQALFAQPKASEVVTRFYQTYDMTFMEYFHVGFEKKNGDWFIVTQRIVGDKLYPIDRMLFYDGKSGSFKELSLDKNQPEKEIRLDEHMDEYTLTNYDIQPFYGYQAWYKDVINYLEKKPALTDWELNALGRAYSTYASGMVSNQLGDTPEQDTWKLEFNQNCLSTEQIKSFNSMIGKAQQCFKKLAERNPGFETRVGSIGLKYANEVMVQYTILLAYAREEALKMKFPDDLYPEDFLEERKNLLNDCPLNSIYVSEGDNDFYPLHYLQQVKNFRRDVHVINYSLLALDRYIYQATYPQYEASAILQSADTSLYLRNINELVMINESAVTITVKDLMKILKSGERDEPGWVTVNTDSISFVRQLPKSPGSIPAKPQNVISVKGERYLFKNQWVLLDIIDNLNGRKICFLHEFYDQLKGLNKHFSRSGMMFVL